MNSLIGDLYQLYLYTQLCKNVFLCSFQIHGGEK